MARLRAFYIFAALGGGRKTKELLIQKEGLMPSIQFLSFNGRMFVSLDKYNTRDRVVLNHPVCDQRSDCYLAS